MALCMSRTASAQQAIGEVSTQDATITGSTEISGGRTLLAASSSVTAMDRTAVIALHRGGEVQVCSTSSLHLTQGRGASGTYSKTGPLLLALDRGALEIRMAATVGDVVMTPDLRFTLHGDGPLDLRLRVTRNGDTCVENHGTKAPGLTIADQFGEATYELRPGQHVLFEHGSLKEVVDNESSPCGCPPAMSVADAGISTDADHAAAAGSTVATKKSQVDEHPFPAAVSEGLAPSPGVPAAPAGAVHAQVSATLSYPGTGDAAVGNGSTDNDSSGGQPRSENPDPGHPTQIKAQAPPPPPAPGATTLGHKIGHFFKRLFGG
jgi:hypothetical protein